VPLRHAKGARKVCSTCRAIYRRSFARCPNDGAPLAPMSRDLIVGATVAGRYVVEECVGEGAMGRVYRARHIHLSRYFALKILFGDLIADSKMRMRFAYEAEAASQMSHPNVVSVFDFGRTDEGLLYLAMEYVQGECLADLLDREAPLGERRAIALARQLCSGLAHAHDHSLVHRDLKPDNVLVVASGALEIPRMLDFGLAISTDEDQRDFRFTTAGLVIGTPAYMSPEQVTERPVDQRSDLFSLGVLMFVMLCGRAPFDGRSIEVAALNAIASPPRLAERNPAVTVCGALEEVVFRLLEKDPADRFQSAREVDAALAAVAAALDDEDGRVTTELRAVPAPPGRGDPLGGQDSGVYESLEILRAGELVLLEAG
jgi:eukaryotic-like serine/threonine-protein kinase